MKQGKMPTPVDNIILLDIYCNPYTSVYIIRNNMSVSISAGMEAYLYYNP